MTRFARLLVLVALLALAAPATAAAKKAHKPDRGAQSGDVRGGDRGRDDDDDDDKRCKEKANRGKHRGRGASNPGRRRGHSKRECDPGTGTPGGDRAFGQGTADGLSFRFDASSGPNGPNPSGTETAFVQFTDASGDTYAGPVRCLGVAGNQAVIGFDNQDPENPQTDVILYVEDNASTGASDRFEAEATLSPELCTAEDVRVPASAITSGDITVQDDTAGGGGGGEQPPGDDDDHGDDDDEPGDEDDDVEEEEDDDEDGDDDESQDSSDDDESEDVDTGDDD